MEVPRGMEPTGTNGRTRHTLSDPLVGRVSSCGGFLVGWQGTLFLVVTTTMLVRRLICLRPLSGSRTATTGIGRVAGSVAGRSRLGVGRLEWFCGGHGPGETPGPFPNPEAKAWHGDGTALERVWESSAPPHSTVWTFWSSPLGDSRKVLFLFSWGFPPGATPRKPPFFVFLPDFSGPSRTSRQRLSGSSKVFFRGLRPSRSSGPPGRASMTPRRVLLLSGAYRRTRVAGDPFFSHDRSDWMVGCGSKLDASLFSNVVQDLQHSIAILLFADVACGMQYPDHFIPFRPHASQFFSAAYPRATNTGLPPSSSSSSLNPLRFSSTRFGSFLSVFSTSPELVSW